ncbi:MAG: hypothetical protein H0X29_07840 [Parachlamydiaceae bacterium]|nr:hypothetical protein [Parachlamydiaceae bacterium]
MDIQTFIKNSPYEISQPQKELLLTRQLNELVQYHYQHCPAYAHILRLIYNNNTDYSTINEIPFLPVNIFKDILLSSISKEKIFKTIVSSGTTGGIPSLITLDSATSQRQSMALATIMQTYLGTKRLPMLIIDSPNAIKDPKHFSARGAGIVGMSQFGCDHLYALDEEMKIKKKALKEWMQKHQGERIFIFGFTYILWEHFLADSTPGEFDFSHAILFHGGGWKKLKEKSIENDVFKKELKKYFNLLHCHSFYGMVEQIGSIFVECEEGNLHCPSFADVIVRNPISWQPAQQGQIGVIQALSLLPTSYPGHSLLTEDLGCIKGIDTCACGRKGKFFWVEGRVPQAEPRGCGDTFTLHNGHTKSFLYNEGKEPYPKAQDFFNFPSSECEHGPFSPILLEFCQNLAKKLSRSNDPDIAALGFWLRSAQLNELKSRFESQSSLSIIRAPRGLVFHITASNVDTLFAYSWILSLLAGNNNIVRLPSKQSIAIKQIHETIAKLLEDTAFKTIARTNSFIRYAHEEDVTTRLSAAADVRIIWGSNNTINEIRNIPINPYAKEIVFPDRTSYAVIASDNYLALNNDQKANLAQSFFRDAYGFDQHGCSSPRVIFWIGVDEETEIASKQFYLFLNHEIQHRGYQVPLSDFLHKQTVIYTLCAQHPVLSVQTSSNELSVLHLKKANLSHSGAGLFYHIALKNLHEMNDHISLRDQTLTYFGFEISLLDQFTKSLKGKGPTRIVPIGEALNFSAVWDGYDIIQELTRCIEIHHTHPNS